MKTTRRKLHIEHRSYGIAITGTNDTLDLLGRMTTQLRVFPFGHEMGLRKSTRVYSFTDFTLIQPHTRRFKAA